MNEDLVSTVLIGNLLDSLFGSPALYTQNHASNYCLVFLKYYAVLYVISSTIYSYFKKNQQSQNFIMMWLGGWTASQRHFRSTYQTCLERGTKLAEAIAFKKGMKIANEIYESKGLERFYYKD